MNATEILHKFNELADHTAPEHALLVRQLGELFYARLVHTTQMYATMSAEFHELASLVITRLKDNERNENEKIEKLIERSHTLSNHFMSVENKVDELAELVMQYFAVNNDTTK